VWCQCCVLNSVCGASVVSWILFVLAFICGHILMFLFLFLFIVHFIVFGCDQRVKITCCKDAITETHARGRESKRQRKEAANNVAAIHLIYRKNSFESSDWYNLVPPNPLL